MSLRLWGLDWSTHLPWRFDELELTAASFALAEPFMRAHYESIFHSDGQAERFLRDPMTTAKRRFAEEMDVSLFRAKGEPVGVLMGHPLDWTTYYFRSVAVLPQYRQRGVLGQVLEHMFEPLAKAGVERIEGDCAPTNAPMMNTLVRMGFVVTSTAVSERWGTCVRLTKFLLREAEEVFARQFCAMRTRPAASSHDAV